MYVDISPKVRIRFDEITSAILDLLLKEDIGPRSALGGV